MAKVAVKLKYTAALSTAEVDELPPGQAHWWLRRESDFVRLPKRVRGDQDLDLVVQLEPGRYTLGVGPSRVSGLREDIVVEIDEASEPKPEAEAAPPKRKKAPAFAKGSLVVEGKTFVITGDLDGIERDAAKAWLVGLGAKVSSSVSAKTDYLLVGRDPGPKKLEKAAELGTRVVSEAELRAAVGEAPPAAPAPAKAKTTDKPTMLATFLAKVDQKKLDMTKIDKLVGPTHFRDLGLHEHELWGISVGPRGGEYYVYIDLKDRPQYAMQCNCREWRPCRHAYALLFTAERHFVPPAPPPDGHEEAARYRPSWE
jgi:hypothetical protein